MFKFNKEKMIDHRKKLDESKNKLMLVILEKFPDITEDEIDEMLMNNMILIREELWKK